MQSPWTAQWRCLLTSYWKQENAMVDWLRKEKEDNKENMSLYKSVIPSFWIVHTGLAYLSQKTKGTKRMHSKRPKCISRGMREGRRQTLCVHPAFRNSPMQNSSSNWNEQQKLPHRHVSPPFIRLAKKNQLKLVSKALSRHSLIDGENALTAPHSVHAQISIFLPCCLE